MEGMEEEYDVLGNFKNPGNILKKFPTAPSLQPPCPNLEDWNEENMLKELEPSPPKKKMAPKSSTGELKKKKSLNEKPNTSSKSKEMPILDLSPENEGAARTRRSLRSSSISQNNSSPVSMHANGRSGSANNGKKSTKGRQRKSNSNVAPVNTVLASRAKPKKSTGGRRKSKNASAATVAAVADTIVIEDSETLSLAQGDRSDAHATRARRNILAERAARCPTLDVVDLVTSPMVPVTGFIDLDADDDSQKTVGNTTQKSLDVSFETDNPVVSVKINWNLKPEIFQLRKYQKFSTVFEQLAKRENKKIDDIFLNIDDRIIKPNDTPADINYKIFQFIDGRVVESLKRPAGIGAIRKRNLNVIKLKVQSDKFKKPFIVEVNKSDNLSVLVIKCAEELKVPYENIIKLCFDGEQLNYHQTPEDLELEGGELIEIYLKE